MKEKPSISTGTDMSSLVSDSGEKDLLRQSQAKEKKYGDIIESRQEKLDALKAPEIPKMPEAPKQSDFAVDPMKTFGSAAMWLGAFGSLLTRHPLATALNSATAVNNAAATGSATAYKTAMDKWKTDSEYAMKLAQFDMDKYKEAISQGESGIRTYAGMMKSETAQMAMQMKQNDQHFKDAERQLKMMEESFKIQGLQGQSHYADLAVKAARDQAVKDGKSFTEEDSLRVYNDALGEAKVGQSGKELKALQADKLAKIDWETIKPDDMVPGTGLTAQAIKGYGEAILSGVKPSQLGLGYSMNPVKKAVENYIFSKNPDFDMAKAQLDYTGKTKEIAALATRSAPAKIAVKEMDKLGKPMIDAVSALNPTEYPNLNSIENAASKGVGGTKVIKANLAVQEFKTAFTNLLVRNGVPTDQARSKADSIVDMSFSIDQIKAVVEQAKLSGAAVLDALEEARGTITGTSDKIEKASEDTPRGLTRNAPLPAPKDNKYIAGQFYDLTAQGHGVHKYLGNGEFE